MKLAASLIVVLSIVVAVVAVLSGFGVRMGWWGYAFGFQLLKASIISALVCGLISLALFFVGFVKHVPIWGKAGLAAFLSIAVAAIPILALIELRKIPTLGEAATNFQNLPAFEALAEAREAEAEDPPRFTLNEAEAAQKKHFPGLRSIIIDRQPAKAKEDVINVLREMGMEIASTSDDDYRVEATETSFWFGFKDDVVVDITNLSNGGSRIEVRSASRVGKFDGGINAKRVEAILAAIQQAQKK